MIFEGVDNKKNGLLIRTLKDFGLENMATEEGKLDLRVSKDKMNWPEIVSIKYSE